MRYLQWLMLPDIYMIRESVTWIGLFFISIVNEWKLCINTTIAIFLCFDTIDQANYQVDISHRMRDSRTAEEDGWSKLCIAMGNSMSRLEVAYLRKM